MNLVSIPREIIAVAVLSWVIAFASVVSPLILPDSRYISGEFIVFASACFLLLYAGLALGFAPVGFQGLEIRRKTAVVVLLLIIGVAVACKLVDRLVLRSAENLLSISDVRAAKEDGSNFFSIVAALAFPFALVYYQKLARIGVPSWVSLVTYLAFMLWLVDTFLVGSRGILLATLITMYTGRLNFSRLITLGLVATVLFSLFFTFRFSSLHSTATKEQIFVNMSTLGYAEFVPAKPAVVDQFYSESVGDLAFSAVHANQYLAHGFFEFAYLYQSAPSFLFDPSAVIPHLNKIITPTASLERYGLYYTLPGSLCIAFGKMAPLACFIWGLALARLYLSATKIALGTQRLVLLSLFLIPFVNSIGGYDLHFFFAAIFLISPCEFYDDRMFDVVCDDETIFDDDLDGFEDELQDDDDWLFDPVAA